jgi:hypothetical protein
MQYSKADDVEKVANAVIREHHKDEFSSKEILYIFQEKKDEKTGMAVAQMRKGKPILGDIKIVSGLNAFLASGDEETDFNGPMPLVVLVVSKHAWNLLKPEQRKAWVDQQFCRLDYDLESGKPSIGDYDVKEMTLIAKRYGAWSDDLSAFFKAAKQYPLFEVEEAPAETKDEKKAKVLKGGNGKAEALKTEGNGKDNAKDETQKAPVANLGSIKDQVAKKRGRAPAARA